MKALFVFLLALRSLCGAACGDYETSSSCVSGENCEWIDNVERDCVPPPETTCSATTGLACSQILGCEWNQASSGTCSGPLTCFGDETTCTGTIGCEYSPSKCGPPSVEDCGIRGQGDCETGNSGCSWIPAQSGCTYPSNGYCEYLAEAECKSTLGCVYHSAYAFCEAEREGCRNLDSSSCESSNRGCVQRPVEKACINPVCDEYGESACRNMPGCAWRDPDISGYCYRDDCENLSPSQCQAEDGCIFEPDYYECMEPNDCYDRSQANCKEGCEWIIGGNGVCEPRSESYCRKQGKEECNDTSGCFWDPEQFWCYERDNEECLCLSEEECNAAFSGCQWSDSSQTCTQHFGNCTTTEANDDCSDLAKSSHCIWRVGFTGLCKAENGLTCTAIAGNTACDDFSVNAGCVWTVPPSYCALSSSINCPTVDGGCAEDADDGCTYRLVGARSHCSVEGDGGCRENAANDNCDTQSNPKCKWITNTGYCTRSGNSPCITVDSDHCSCGSDPTCILATYPAHCEYDWNINCYDFNSASACGSKGGCNWISSPGQCILNSDGGVRCYNNSEGTGCDVTYSDKLCQWESQNAACVPNDNLNCPSNADGTCSNGADVGCKPLALPGECSVRSNLYCVTNTTNNGCNTTTSDAGCTWKPASTASCAPAVNLDCVASGEACSSGSQSVGCVWVTFGQCREKEPEGKASLVAVPSLILLVFALLLL